MPHDVILDEFFDNSTPDLVGDVRPTIESRESDDSVTPVYTESYEAVTENDTERHQSLCGETTVEPIGEYEWRITISGIVVESQLKSLIEMRPAGTAVDVVTNVQTHEAVNFDRFRYKQKDEYQRGNFTHPETGEDIVERVYTFSLQTQDDDQSGN